MRKGGKSCGEANKYFAQKATVLPSKQNTDMLHFNVYKLFASSIKNKNFFFQNSSSEEANDHC